jgi:PAS domain S-box-containing protein
MKSLHTRVNEMLSKIEYTRDKLLKLEKHPNPQKKKKIIGSFDSSDIKFNSDAGIFKLEFDGSLRLKYANMALVRMFGFRTKNKILEVPWDRLLKNTDHVLSLGEKLLKNGNIKNAKIQLLIADGSLSSVSVSASVSVDFKTRNLFIDGMVRKDVEMNEINEFAGCRNKLMTEVYDSIPDMFFSIKPDYRITSVNKSAWRELGYRKSELIGQFLWKFVHPNDKKFVKGRIKEIILTKNTESEFDFSKISKKGLVIHANARAQLVFDDRKNITDILIICRDVTRRKLAEEALKASEEKFRSITSNINTGIYRSTTDEPGKFIEVNPAFIKIFGFRNKSELLLTSVSDLYFDPNDRLKLKKIIQKKGFVKNRELKFKKKSGEVIIASVSSVLIKDKHGKPEYYDGIIEDITERKMGETLLKSSEYKYRTLIETFPDIIFITDYESKMLFANQALKNQTGYTIEDFQIPQRENKFIHPDDVAKVADFIEKFINSRKKHSEAIENRFVDKLGNEQWYSSVISKVQFDYKPALQFIVRNITKQKEASEKLRKKDEQYEVLFNISPSGILIEDAYGKIVHVNPSFCEIMGYKPEELIGKQIHMIAPPGSKDSVDRNIARLIAGKKLKHVVQSVKKDGSVAYMELNERKYILPDGNVGILSIAEDISKRVNAENELKAEHVQSERQHHFIEAILSATPYPIFYKDANGRYIGCNMAFTEQLGITSGEIKGKTVHELWPSDNAEIYHQKDLELLKNPERQVYQWFVTDKSGEKRDVVFSKDAFFDEKGNVAGLVGAYMDITNVIRAENALKDSEARWRSITENSPDNIYTLDNNLLIEFVNHPVHGRNLDQLIGQPLTELLPENIRKTIAEILNNVLVSGKAATYETFNITGENKLIYYETLAVPRKTGNGIAGLTLSERNITERKNAAEAIQESRRRVATLMANLPGMAYRGKNDERCTMEFVSGGCFELTGYHPEDLVNNKKLCFVDLIHPDDKKYISEQVKDALIHKVPFRMEYRIITATGQEKWVWEQGIGIFSGNEVTALEGFITDITEKKIAAEAIRKSEESYRGLFNSATEAIYIQDEKGLFVDVNKGAEKMYGYPRDYFIGRTPEFLSAPGLNDLEKTAKHIKKAFEGTSQNFEFWGVDSKGRVFPKEVRLYAGKYFGKDVVIAFAQDISERKQAQKILEENEQRFRRIFNAFPDIYFRSSPNGVIEEISPSVERITGYKPEEVIGKNSVDFYANPSDWDQISEIISKKYQVNDYDTRIKTRKGKILDFSISAKLILDQDKQLMGIEVEQSPAIIVITDLQGNIEYVNPKFTQVTGYKFDEVKGKNPRVLKSGNTPVETYNTLWETITSGRDWYGEFINKTKDGFFYWESANIFPLKDDNGITTHYIALKEDITVRKKMEQELINAKIQAEESDKLKSAFLANMSHEIRTPMNSIIGFSQLLSEPDIEEPERSHFIELIQKSGNDLISLIDDIIDISKIEAGQMKVYHSQYYLNNILTEVVVSLNEFLKTRKDKSHLKLNYNKPANAEKVVIFTDIDRFKQIIRNLINNAIKFTDTGLIELGFEIKSNKKSSFIEFYVRDTGIGIPEDKCDVIFESFRQVNMSGTRLYGGTGLGLAITKKIVEILGGRIWVQSVLGQGSTFYFTLPYNPVINLPVTMEEGKSLKSMTKYNWKNKRILIVEDDDQSFIFFERILKGTGAEVIRALDGKQAIDFIQREKFNLVLMDIQLPEMDGYASAGKIKKLNPGLPVIAQTAYAMSGEKDRSLKAGCNDYISKPIKINDLLTIIAKYI